jgi:signal transduction histidine kinase
MVRERSRGGTVDNSQNGLVFPDGPRSELDRLLSDLVTSAQKVQGTQGRLRSLLQATQAIVEQTDLPVVLRRIVEAAVDLVGARYGALGVIAPDGHLEQFIHVGMPDDTVSLIGHLPEGHGILGALVDDPRPIRLEHLSEDPRSSGFPEHHPPMESFLGVPVRVRDEVFGNLYLTEQESGLFSPEDKELLTSLAATAGIAIDNARLLDETRRRQRWSAASAEIAASLIAEESTESLGFLADRVTELSDADLVMVILPGGENSLIVETVRGHNAAELRGRVFDAAGSIAGRALESGQPVLVDVNEGEGERQAGFALGPTMAIPLMGSAGQQGVLTVARHSGRSRFLPVDIEMAADFAGQASIAIELGRARADSQRLAVLEDRGRIARDLHDHVIQRLFGAGLSLQALSGTMTEASARASIDEQVDALDAAIAQIRTAIFALKGPARSDGPSLKHRVLDMLAEIGTAFDHSPRVVFSGPIDVLVPVAMIEDVLAVIREGLANVARHAGANNTVVTVAAANDEVIVEVVDDGVGISLSPQRRSGTDNLDQRARRWGGSFSLTPVSEGGTILRWTGLVDHAEVSE